MYSVGQNKREHDTLGAVALSNLNWLSKFFTAVQQDLRGMQYFSSHYVAALTYEV